MSKGRRRVLFTAGLTAFAVALPLVANAVYYTVSTVAGGGGTGTYCNSTPTPGTQLDIQGPWTVAADSSGNIYYVDRSRVRVCKIAPNGNVTIFAGTGSSGIGADGIQATASALSDPTTVATDSAGNVYVVEYSGSYAVRKISTSGIITTIFNTSHTNAHAGDGGLAINASGINPSALAIAPTGEIYFSEFAGHYVRKIDTNGYITTFAGNGINSSNGNGIAATSASVLNVSGIAVDLDGNVFLAQYNGCIRKVSASTGIITTYAGTCGTLIRAGDGLVATSATFLNIWQIAIDSAGNIFVPERAGYTIRKIDGATKIVSTIAGSTAGATDGSTSSATFDSIFGAAISPSGDLYVGEYGNNRVRKIAGVAAEMLSAPSLTTSGFPFFRTSYSVTSTGGSSGKITFYANGKKIAGCIGRAYTGSFTCSWRPATRGSVNIYSEVTSASNGKVRSSALNIAVGKRIGLR